MEAKHESKKWLLNLYVGFVLFGIIGTAISSWLKINPGPIAPAVSVIIILIGSSVVAIEIGRIVSNLGVLLLCGLAEIVGVFTGWPFGRYEYTDRWWPTVLLGGQHLFPLLIPFAWLLILGSAFQIARSRFGRWSAVLVSACVTTLIDIPLERAMVTVFGYWKWEKAGPLFGAPVSNSIGWFIVSCLGASILAANDSETVTRNSLAVLMTFCGFMAVTGLIHGFDWAWIVLASIPLMLKYLQK